MEILGEIGLGTKLFGIRWGLGSNFRGGQDDGGRLRWFGHVNKKMKLFHYQYCHKYYIL